LDWGGIATVGGDMSEPDQQLVIELINSFGDVVEQLLTAHGVDKSVSPIFRPFSTIVGWDREKVIVVFAKASGIVSRVWLDLKGEIIPPSALVADVRRQTNHEITAVVTLPPPPGESSQIEAAAGQHTDDLERQLTLVSRLVVDFTVFV